MVFFMNLGIHSCIQICTNIYFVLFKVGHSKKSCKMAKAEADPEALSEDDKIFWEHVREDARPRNIPSRLVGQLVYLYILMYGT